MKNRPVILKNKKFHEMSPRSANLIPTRQQPCPTCHPLASVQCPGRQKLSHTRTPCAPFTANWAPTSAPLRIVPKPFSVTYKPTLVLTSSSNGTTSVYTPFKPLSPLFTLPTVLRLSLSLLSLPNSTVTFLALSQSRFCKKKIRGRFGSLNQAFVS